MTMLWLLQNLLGRPARTLLTVSGIAVGIFALVLLGGIAEQINRLITGGERYLTGQILVLPRSGGFTGILNMETADRIRTVPGVEAVAPGFTMMLDDGHGPNGLAMPPMIQTIDPSSGFRNRNMPRLPMRAGRYLRPGERGAVMLGRDLAQERGWRCGDVIRLRGRVFRVVGLLERTFTGPDSMAFVATEDGRDLFLGQNMLAGMYAALYRISGPGRTKASWAPENFASSLAVSWREDADPERIARRLARLLPEARVTSPAEVHRRLAMGTVVLNALVLGSALISLLVGGLSVVNTMATAVLERTREIGIKKAVGAKVRHIAREFLAEAALIGLLGGLVGLAAGLGMSMILNRYFAGRGAEIFLLTPRLLLLALLFSVVLGAAAGLYPAWRAARLEPVEALQYE